MPLSDLHSLVVVSAAGHSRVSDVLVGRPAGRVASLMPRSPDGEEDAPPVHDGGAAPDHGVGGAIDALASSLSALEAPRDLANDNSLVVAARAAASGRGEKRADGPFCEVDFSAAKDERSEAGPYTVFGSASSGNGEDENAVMRRMPSPPCCSAGRRSTSTSFRATWPTARLQAEARPDPTRRNADALREGDDEVRRVGGVVDEVRRMGGGVGKVRRAPGEVGKGRCAGGAADVDGSAQPRSRPRRPRLVRRTRMVSNLKMFLVSNSTGPPRRSAAGAIEAPRIDHQGQSRGGVARFESGRASSANGPRKNCRESILNF